MLWLTIFTIISIKMSSSQVVQTWQAACWPKINISSMSTIPTIRYFWPIILMWIREASWASKASLNIYTNFIRELLIIIHKVLCHELFLSDPICYLPFISFWFVLLWFFTFWFLDSLRLWFELCICEKIILWIMLWLLSIKNSDALIILFVGCLWCLMSGRKVSQKWKGRSGWGKASWLL